MKDMVKRPQQKYESLFRELEEFKRGGHDINVMCAANSNSAANAAANAANSVANTEANDAMKNELKRYLLELNAPQSNSDFMEMGSVLPINNSLLKSY
jgi:3-methyladenine DNA glycosylase Tag